jgi:hypothetical protein
VRGQRAAFYNEPLAVDPEPVPGDIRIEYLIRGLRLDKGIALFYYPGYKSEDLLVCLRLIFCEFEARED